ncbi:hypothetical protein V8E51_018244 [Hyaloscypha variabilis]
MDPDNTSIRIIKESSKPNRKGPRLRAARLRRQRPYYHPRYDFTRRNPSDTTTKVRENKSKPTRIPLKSFGPKPLGAWHCVRTRRAVTFGGIEEMQEVSFPFRRYGFEEKVAGFLERFSTIPVMEVLPTHTPATRGNTNLGLNDNSGFHIQFKHLTRPPPSYHMKQTCFPDPISPPIGRHVVLGIFDESGALLDEVILYAGGPSISKQLVKARRQLFSLPILRDIKSFELYKCDHQYRAHVRVETTQEAQDCLAALFRCVERWEGYYRLCSFLDTIKYLIDIGGFYLYVPCMIPLSVLLLFRKGCQSTRV